MKITTRLLWCAVLMLAGSSAFGQNKLQIIIKGSCSTLDTNGHIVSVPVNNHSLLQDFAQSHGVSDLSTLGLAYHVGGNDLGDTIDVINRTDGSTVYTLFGLYFGESFGRTALLSGSGKQLKRLEYIYTDQNSHSLGSVLLTDYYFLDSNGQTNATYVLGQMQYIVTPTGNHANTLVCTASFNTLRPWTFAH
jgi:hypothetical protein